MVNVVKRDGEISADLEFENGRFMDGVTKGHAEN
jgi:hypothetical protein